MGELLPCPFCGGEAARFTIGNDEPNNAGGDVITCTRCQASSHVEFGRKENLVDRWNARTNADHITRLESDVAIARAALERIAEGGCVEVVGPGEIRFAEWEPRQWAREALSRISGEGRTGSGAPADAVQALVSDQAASRLAPSGFDPSRLKRPGFAERLTEFEERLFAIRWVSERVMAGQQFNCYMRAAEADDDYDDGDDEDREFMLCVGPITDSRYLCDVSGKDRAELIESALKVATEAFRERETPNA